MIEKQLELKTSSNNIKYKIKNICNITIYIIDFEIYYLSNFYHLVFLKNYSKNKNTLEFILVVQ